MAATVTVVLPILNEQETLPELYQRLVDVFAELEEQGEFLFVDDGSTDDSALWIAGRAQDDPRVKLLQLSRNFGHQVAISAGLDYADGDAVIIMDADLQDPPSLISEMLASWREGNEVVYAVRRNREGEGWLKKTLAAGFYRVFKHMVKLDVPLDAGDFRLLDAKVVRALRSMREQHRFIRGMTSWAGFKAAPVYYDRSARYAGSTKYPTWKSFHLAVDAITSFSATPLRWIMALGLLFAGIGFAWVLWIVIQKLVAPDELERGWASLAAMVMIMGGLQLSVLGVLGVYISRIFEEAKQRPLYYVRESVGFGDKLEIRNPKTETSSKSET